jgi:threo-3-hydroxy-L-aspartate ammonia-lyase
VAGASSGNHAQVLALAGRLLTVPVTVMPSADDTAVMAGAGTVVAAKSINAESTVIGVEPCMGGDTAASFRAGHLVTLPAVPDTVADGLRHTSPAPVPREVSKVFLDDVVTVTDTASTRP